MLLDAAAPGELPRLLAEPSDRHGRSPLHFAAAAGDYAGAQLLISRGADVDVSRGGGGLGWADRLLLAIETSCPRLPPPHARTQCCDCHPTLQAPAKDGATPCAYAAAAGACGVMGLLLDAGAAADKAAADGSTPLLCAAGGVQLLGCSFRLVCAPSCCLLPDHHTCAELRCLVSRRPACRGGAHPLRGQPAQARRQPQRRRRRRHHPAAGRAGGRPPPRRRGAACRGGPGGRQHRWGACPAPLPEACTAAACPGLSCAPSVMCAQAACAPSPPPLLQAAARRCTGRRTTA